MRYILILIFVLVTIQADEKKQTLTMGLGAYMQTQPYKDVDTIVLPTPVIFYDNGIVYARWSRAGIYFFGEKTDDYGWGFSLTIQPRTFGYKPSDSNYLRGLDEKKTTWEGGLAFSASMDKAYIEIMALTDILDRYESWIVKTEIGYDFKVGDFLFYPSFIVVYQSSEFLDYYYGISSDEAITSNYNTYTTNNDFQIGLQTYIKYPLTNSLATLLNIRADRLSNEAIKSPIVHDDYIFSGMLSLIYTFKYGHL
jgi:outer membrane protein